MKRISDYQFYVEHPSGRKWFGELELKQASAFAQSLANETGKPIKRYDVKGGHSIFYPAY